MSNERYAYILLSDEKWWNRLIERNISNNETSIFVRKGLVGPVEAEKLFFYVKRPIAQIRGVADFIERLAGDYKELWGKYGNETCLKCFHEYADFLQGRKKVSFIRFTSFRVLPNPISMKAINKVLGISRMPRGGKYINRETANQLTV